MTHVEQVEDLDLEWQMECGVRPASDYMWTVRLNGRPMVVAGVRRNTLIGPYELWILPCSEFYRQPRASIKVIKHLLKLLVAKFGKLTAWADPRGCKFARLMGFRVVRQFGQHTQLEVG